MTAPLSPLDRNIVAALQTDPRASWPTVARLAGTTETTAARRTARLVESGVVRLRGVADPIRCGFGRPVLLQLRCTPSHAREVAEALSARSDVRFCGLTTGRWDVVAELISPSRDDLTRVLVDELGELPGIVDSSTAMVTRNFKTSYDWSRRLLEERDGDPDGSAATRSPRAATPEPSVRHDASAAEPVTLDEADLALLAAVSANARRPYAEMAAELSLSETAVRRRVDRLLREGCLLLAAFVEPEALGFHLELLAWLKVAPQQLDSTAAVLATHPEVRYLSATAGSADLVCEVVLREHGDLYPFTTEVLGSLSGLVSTDIGVELGTRKRAWHGSVTTAPTNP